MEEALTQDILKKYLSYDKKTGIFRWLQDGNNQFIKKDAIAGTKTHYGYIHIRLNGVAYPAHRLAFLYMTGKMSKFVDHENHNRSDNRWENLKESTVKKNNKNQSIPKNNTSGVMGVYKSKNPSKWYATIRVNGEQKYLGSYSEKKDAIKARKKAEEKYGFHKNHGRET